MGRTTNLEARFDELEEKFDVVIDNMQKGIENLANQAVKKALSSHNPQPQDASKKNEVKTDGNKNKTS